MDFTKTIERLDKKVEGYTKVITPTDIEAMSVKGGYHTAWIRGKKYSFKTPPKNILEFINEYTPVNLYPKQQEILATIRGTNPVEWDTTYSQITMLIGQGGGKNTMAKGDAAYQCYFLGNIVGDPYELMSLFADKEIERGANFEITNNSMAGEQQASTVFFDLIKQMLRATKYEGKNWFAEYMDLNLAEDGLGDIKSRVIKFPRFADDAGMIVLHSLDSKISSPEGKSILTAYLDEPSRAHTESTYKNAKTLHGVVVGNTSGRFPRGCGKVVAFSYPNMSEYDLTYELVEKAQEDERQWQQNPENRNKGIAEYVKENPVKYFIFSTFEINPTVKRTDPAKIVDYRNEPEMSAARYECIKSKSQYAFFKPYVHKIEECVLPHISNRIKTVSKTHTRMGNDYVMLEIEDIKPDHKQRICAADFSINKANSALFLGYNETMQVQEDVFKNRYFDKDYSAATDAAQRVVIDTMLVWTPDKKRKIAIDYHNAREMIKVILEKFNIVKFICDNYQLEWLAAMFEEAGVEVEKFAFTTPVQWEFYTQFKTGLAAETVRYINHPLFMEEAKRVQRSSEKNNKIIPGNGFTKDLIDVGTMIYHAGIDRTFVETTTDYSIDTLNDAKLLEMVNNYAKCYNEAIRGHMGDVKGYIQSKMLLSDRQYEMLEEAVADLMPT